jgi:hypothetical protein
MNTSVTYDPPRQSAPKSTGDPMEIELVFNVRPCGTCSFFWPQVPTQQPYGPYPAYDFDTNTPATNAPNGSSASFAWLTGTTRPPAFPDAEIMDGCRKAPIMTLGINPNLTAFLPGETGAACCYPSFSSAGGTDSWTKYAYYYRYRSVYQERFDLRFVEQFLLTRDRIVAPRPGVIVAADRPSDGPGFALKVRYDGDAQDTTIPLPSSRGEPRYVLLLDIEPPRNRFLKNDVIAARLDVPAARKAEIYAHQIGYYRRIVPVLGHFASFLQRRGHREVRLQVGEDVCQLDMVACASPHWGPPWLGGTSDAVRAIIANCVSKNAWAIKQLVQTRPAVVFLVGEATFNMFRYAFGALIKCEPAMPENPADGAFSLLRTTTDPAHPCTFEFSQPVAAYHYAISTRLVVTPHFSYDTNFLPQFRLSVSELQDFQSQFPDCARFLQTDSRVHFVPPAPGAFATFQVLSDEQGVIDQVHASWPDAAERLTLAYYDPNAMMASVLEDEYRKGRLSYVDHTAPRSGFLARTDGPCVFCVNRHWTFPLGCPYGKPTEAPLPTGLLENVAAEIIRSGAARQSENMVSRMIDDGFEARHDACSLHKEEPSPTD